MELCTREEGTDFIYVVAFPYVVVLVEAETDDNLPVTLQILVTIRIVNPAKALFETEDWMKVVSGTVISAARNFVGSKPYADLVSEAKIESKGGTAEGDRLDTSVCKLNEKLADGSPGLHERYGVVVDKADIQRVDIAGARKEEILDATVQQYTADQRACTVSTIGKADADAIRTKGTAEADVIAKKGEAEASAIEKKGLAEAKALTARLKSWNDGGTLNGLIAQTEAMSAPGENKTVIWANNPFVKKVDGLAETLESLNIHSLDDLKRNLGIKPENSQEKSA